MTPLDTFSRERVDYELLSSPRTAIAWTHPCWAVFWIRSPEFWMIQHRPSAVLLPSIFPAAEQAAEAVLFLESLPQDWEKISTKALKALYIFSLERDLRRFGARANG